MALTVTTVHKELPHGQHAGHLIAKATFTTGTNYVTNGATVNLSALKFPVAIGEIKVAKIVSNLGHTGVYVPGTNWSDGKIKLFNGTTEIANDASLNGVVLTVDFLVAGARVL